MLRMGFCQDIVVWGLDETLTATPPSPKHGLQASKA